MKLITTLAALGLAMGIAAGNAQADNFGSGGNAFTIDFVTVGNPGNGNDAAGPTYTDDGGNYASPYGGVDYTYRMGVHEISQDQITKATAGGLENVTAGPHTGPAATVSWYEAAAFVNWLNDQKTPGLKAYDLNFNGVWSMSLWNPLDSWDNDPGAGFDLNQYRHKNAYYFLPSEDEWYKAAYHKNDGVTANYWDYATGSNAIPTAIAGGTAAGTAVFNGQPDPADVTLAGGLSPYLTMGQNGNVSEWNESALDGGNSFWSEIRGIRGGLWNNTENLLRSSVRYGAPPTDEGTFVGFRVASIPEPSTALLMLAGLGAFLLMRCRNSSL